jgi:hypothetical protein
LFSKNEICQQVATDRIQDWMTDRSLWQRLCEFGELFDIQLLSEQTGLDYPILVDALHKGVNISSGRNRIQHLCQITEKLAGSDSESTARTILTKWFTDQQYHTYGKYGQEVSFGLQGVNALCKVARSGKIEDWCSIKNHLTSNGIDLVTFSEANKEVWVIELKGWTGTTSDFNETIHQILKRILVVSNCCNLPENLKFACGFPIFRKVPEWESKFLSLKSIQKNSENLLLFSCATTTPKEKGESFLRNFLSGQLGINELLKSKRLMFFLIRSPVEVRELVSNSFFKLK